MSRVATRITVVEADRTKLQKWSQSRSAAQRLVLRAGIILRAAAGEKSKDIAAALHTSRPTVQLWRDRFLELGVKGLEQDASRPGRKIRLGEEKVREVVELTLHKKPRAETHWSQRLMAEQVGLSKSTVQRICIRVRLRRHG
jgi:transposase